MIISTNELMTALLARFPVNFDQLRGVEQAVSTALYGK